jgi:hypothetical protein
MDEGVWLCCLMEGCMTVGRGVALEMSWWVDTLYRGMSLRV